MNTPYNIIVGKDIRKLSNAKIVWWQNNNALLEIDSKKVAVITTADGSPIVKSIWDYEKEIA